MKPKHFIAPLAALVVVLVYQGSRQLVVFAIDYEQFITPAKQDDQRSA